MAAEKVKVKLYWLERSRAQNILWLLEELKIDYELETFRRGADKLAPAELKKIHPLGKSPLISITAPGSSEPLVLAESGFIAQYLSEHFGRETTTMMPRRWKEGREGQVGGETSEWLRWQYLLHFVEGSLMPILTVSMILGIVKGPMVPFFIRPLTALVADKIFGSFIYPNIQSLLKFLENQLETSGGDFLCGEHLTSADVLISFALVQVKDKIAEFGSWPSGDPRISLPKLYAYIERLECEPGYEKSIEKIMEIDSSLGIKF